MSSGLYGDLKVIDVDAHWSEPHDLWTSLAPAKYRDRVPQVKEINGKRRWYIEDIPLGRLSATSAIPFLLEALDYQFEETNPTDRANMSMRPSEYFRRQFYGCFWFESAMIPAALDYLGDGCVMFMTDIPHPTSLYPRALERQAALLDGLSELTRRRVLQDNAAQLYRISL